MSVQIKVYKNLTDIKESWRLLNQLATDDSIYTKYDWCESWLEVFYPNAEIFLYSAYYKNKIAALIPLYLKDDFFKSINLIGDDLIDQYIFLMNHEIIRNNKDKEVINSLLSAIYKDFYNNCVIFKNLDNSYLSKYRFRNTLTINRGHVYKLKKSNFFISSKQKKKTRYLISQITKNYHQYLVDIDCDNLPQTLIPTSLNYKKNRLKEIKSFSKLIEDSYVNKMHLFFSSLHKKLLLHSSFLNIENTFVATHIGFKYKDKVYYVIPSYNDAFQKFSPGKLLLNSIIEKSFNKDFVLFDFGYGDEEYKKNYDCDKYPVSSIVLITNLSSLFSGTALKTRQFLSSSSVLRDIYIFLRKTLNYE